MFSVRELRSLVTSNPLTDTLYRRVSAAKQLARLRFLAERQQWRAVRRGLVYSEAGVAEQVKERLRQRGLVVTPRRKGDIRTLWVGAFEPQDRSGTIQGLEKFGEVTCLYNGSAYGQAQLTPAENHSAILATAERMGRVDLLVGNMYGVCVSPKTLLQIAQTGAVIANIAMDDRHTYFGTRLPDGRWSGPAGLLPGVDLATTTTRDTCINYLMDNTPAIWLPMGSDPEIFQPNQAVRKDIDVSFVGAKYGIRAEIVEGLRKLGIQVQAWGQGWENGFLSTEEVPNIIARSRICLGVSSIGHTWSLTNPKLRDYDMPMAGAFYLTQHTPDIVEHFVPTQEIETYRSIKECARKARWYLDHPEQAEAIGLSGRARCLRDHTWEGRFQKLLETVGLVT